MSAALSNAIEVIWRPQPGPQTALLACPIFEVFYGGARGGGKTDGMLGEFASHASRYGKDANGLMVRRSRTELVDTIERSKVLYGQLGWEWKEQDKLWRSPDGARLRFAYLENDADAEAYQGHSYTRVYVEEVGNFPNPAPVMKLMATLRSGAGVPVGFRATGNPGGPGHQWVKARYIDPAPLGFEVIKTEFRNPFTKEIVYRERVFIPARVTDNRYLGGDYVANLQMAGSPELVRAWLEGDWNVIAGAFFPEFSIQRHVIDPMILPAEWTRYRSGDWGSAKPFSFGWYAISDGSIARFPRGALIKYREWYGVKTNPDGTYEPNVGVRMIAEEVGRGIMEREVNERVDEGLSVIDPAAFTADGGPSIAERMFSGTKAKVAFRRADNKRTAAKGAIGGWDQVRSRLIGTCDRNRETGEILWDTGRPMLYFFSTCRHTIRTLPALQHDPSKPEDVDTEGEDHAPDETRYACMARTYIQEAPHEAEVIPIRGQFNGFQTTQTMDEMWRDAAKQQTAQRRI